MVYLTGAQCEGRSIKLGSPDVMFDASTWRIRNIWDGVKLEVAGDASPVVLHSFTQLDPDLPQLEGNDPTHLQAV
ncbi:Ral guanine nucleotide dissociation stimulator [Salmo salar]|uniref:Ral guanine nucleotide dissociation stimulator n=1 Tax=Salmo salar TaxID=8030 RepID=B5X7G6_SALSA|nr:Ral guanine nucleotide dissociation stimulator [Salmo salar]ACI66786.1 Ral guanine nucleotide dissociation stimulator [Salmo salar]|eukprot:NP_001134249.1 Ral guanine nucleotide dissociation stimulator [Salmo salar]